MKPSTLAIRPTPNSPVNTRTIKQWIVQFDGADYALQLQRLDLHVTDGCAATVHVTYANPNAEKPRVWICAPAEIVLGDFRLSVARVAGPKEKYKLTAYAHGREVVIESASLTLSIHGGPSITYTYA